MNREKISFLSFGTSHARVNDSSLSLAPFLIWIGIRAMLVCEGAAKECFKLKNNLEHPRLISILKLVHFPLNSRSIWDKVPRDSYVKTQMMWNCYHQCGFTHWKRDFPLPPVVTTDEETRTKRLRKTVALPSCGWSMHIFFFDILSQHCTYQPDITTQHYPNPKPNHKKSAKCGLRDPNPHM